jgi:hypothetical protein
MGGLKRFEVPHLSEVEEGVPIAIGIGGKLLGIVLTIFLF